MDSGREKIILSNPGATIEKMTYIKTYGESGTDGKIGLKRGKFV